jgi:hypothetical protein
MGVRLLGEGTQLKPSLAGVFVRRLRGGEDAYPSVRNPPAAALRVGWTAIYQGLPDVAWRSTSPTRRPALACGR